MNRKVAATASEPAPPPQPQYNRDYTMPETLDPSVIARRYFSSNPASFLATGTFLRV